MYPQEGRTSRPGASDRAKPIETGNRRPLRRVHRVHCPQSVKRNHRLGHRIGKRGKPSAAPSREDYRLRWSLVRGGGARRIVARHGILPIRGRASFPRPMSLPKIPTLRPVRDVIGTWPSKSFIQELLSPGDVREKTGGLRHPGGRLRPARSGRVPVPFLRQALGSLRQFRKM